MVDVFMIHRAANTSEQKLRYELIKARSEIGELTLKLGDLEQLHDQVVADYLADAKAMREAKAENEKLKASLERLSGIEEAVKRDIAPTMIMSLMAVSKLNRDISRWVKASTGGTPTMPIDPEMKKVFASLHNELCKHIKGFDPEENKIVELGE